MDGREAVSMSEQQRCSMCGGLGWTLDARLANSNEEVWTNAPQVEFIPCIFPGCEVSGRPIQSVCFKDVEFTEISRRPDGVVMKVGRPL